MLCRVTGVEGVGRWPFPPQDQTRARGRCTRSGLGGAHTALACHSCVVVLATSLVGPKRRPVGTGLQEILMTSRLYGLLIMSVISALIIEFLTPRMLTLLPVPW